MTTFQAQVEDLMAKSDEELLKIPRQDIMERYVFRSRTESPESVRRYCELLTRWAGLNPFGKITPATQERIDALEGEVARLTTLHDRARADLADSVRRYEDLKAIHETGGRRAVIKQLDELLETLSEFDKVGAKLMSVRARLVEKLAGTAGQDVDMDEET